MGSTKTTQTQSNSFGYMTPPTSSAQAAYDQHVAKAYDTPDPTIPFTFGNMKQNVGNRLDNPFGFNYSPEVSDAIKYSQNNQIDQMHGQASREDLFNRNAAKTQALAGSAAGHAPQLIQTGGTGTTVQSQGIGSLLMGGLNAGASLGSAAMMSWVVCGIIGVWIISQYMPFMMNLG